MSDMTNDDVIEFELPNGNTFDGLDLEILAEDYMEVCLGTVVVDKSFSMTGQEKVVVDMYNQTIQFLTEESPYKDRIMLRLTDFSTSDAWAIKIDEVHGFAPVDEIDTSQYQGIVPENATPLFEAGIEAVEVSTAYAEKAVAAASIKANGIITLLTDGDSNGSASATDFAQAAIDSVGDGKHESLVLLLIGINSAACASQQEEYAQEIQGVLDAEYFEEDEDKRPVRFIYRRSDKFDGKEVGKLIGNLTESQSASVGGGAPSQAPVADL